MTKLGLIIFSLIFTGNALAKEPINPISTSTNFVPWKIKKEYESQHPITSASDLGAAVIDVLTMINNEGQTTHTKILRSTNPRFNEKAETRIKKIWFAPATLNGDTVVSSFQRRLFFLPYLRPQAVSPEFNRKFKIIKTELENRDQDPKTLRSLLDELDTSDKTYYTIARINELEAAYAIKFSDTWKLRDALENALLFEDHSHQIFSDYLSKDVEYNLRNKLSQLYIDLHQPKKAQQEITKLSQLHHQPIEGDGAEKPKSLLELNSKLQKLKTRIKTAASLAMRVELGNRQYTTSEMVRRGFAIFDVKGEIEPFEFYCDAKYKKMAVEAELTYKIPSSWGNCLVVWQGSENASFVFVQQ